MADVPSWAFMGLLGLFQAVIILMLTRLGQQTDQNTQAVHNLAVNIPTNYSTKMEAEHHHNEDRREFDELHTKVHDLRNSVHTIELKNAAVYGQGGRG